MPSTTQSPTPSTIHALALQFGRDAVDNITLAEDCALEFRAILKAILRLSGDDEVIHGLAKVAIGIADDRCNLFACVIDAASEKLLYALNDQKGQHSAVATRPIAANASVQCSRSEVAV